MRRMESRRRSNTASTCYVSALPWAPSCFPPGFHHGLERCSLVPNPDWHLRGDGDFESISEATGTSKASQRRRGLRKFRRRSLCTEAVVSWSPLLRSIARLVTCYRSAKSTVGAEARNLLPQR
eukprot:1187484-Amorphochlora_amoeboformis.AAC.1